MSGLLALVTIGQSPRVDVLPDLAPVLESRRYAEYGALDHATEDQLVAIAPHGDEVPLISRMRDGSRVSMSHARVLPFIVAAAERAAADGAEAALLMCTGHFEPFETVIPVYAAEPLAQQTIAETVSGFGVLNPVPEQIEESQMRWEARAGGAVPVAAADPYTATDHEIAAGARELAARGATSIVLDCFGYSTAMAAVAHAATGLPVHVTRLVATRAALERLDG